MLLPDRVRRRAGEGSVVRRLTLAPLLQLVEIAVVLGDDEEHVVGGETCFAVGGDRVVTALDDRHPCSGRRR